jgi:hypothetical protein
MKSSPAQQSISALERARWSAKARFTAVDEQGLVNSRRISGGCKSRRASPKSSAENPETETCPLLAAGLRLIKLTSLNIMSKTSVSLIFVALALHVSTGFASTQSEYYGEQVPGWPPTRTVFLSDTARYLNVTRWEVIRLVHDNAEITWKFDGLKTEFNLQDIVPANITSHRIIVYITPRDDDE